MGMQHVVAMFGATVLTPVIMNFDPQLAIFFSGVGTLIFLAMTRLKVPSYLGSNFSFIGPGLAVTGGHPALIPEALCGIAGAAVLYAVAAWATVRYGPAWIEALMPAIVTGTVVAIIGLNLASSAVANAVNAEFTVRNQRDVLALAVAVVTLLTAALVSIHARGFLRLLPVLMGVIVGYALAALLGRAYLGDAAVDFADHRNLVVAGTSLIVATGLGVRGITVGGTNLAGIAVGTVLALAIHLIFRISPGNRGQRTKRSSHRRGGPP